MNLEDHLGDIVGKARSMAGVSVEAAAQAAGLGAADYPAFEQSGQSTTRPNLAALATLIGLNPEKLSRVAAGWTPAAKELSLWRELRVLVSGNGRFNVNCFLAWDEVTRDAALFDTGFDAAAIEREVAANELQLRHIFITHSHHDHVACLAALREKFPQAMLHTDAKNALPQQKNRRNDCIQLGSLRVTNRPTPGHAEDGVTYLIGNWPGDAPQVAVVGDTMFAGSAGGMDGSWPAARKIILEQILALPPDTLLCPGHGPVTTVAEERLNNPFF